MNVLALWEHALDHLRATEPGWQEVLDRWRGERPEAYSDRDLLSEYAWVVFSCGLTPQVVQKYWDRMGEAYFGWDPAAVCERRRDVQVAALHVVRNPRKVTAVLDFADDLARDSGLMERLARLSLKEALARLTTLPFVGANNRYHLARNLGWDVVVKTGPVPRLAAYLETTSEELCAAIARLKGERIRTVDLVLWHWGHQVGDKAVREFAAIVRMMPGTP